MKGTKINQDHINAAYAISSKVEEYEKKVEVIIDPKANKFSESIKEPMASFVKSFETFVGENKDAVIAAMKEAKDNKKKAADFLKSDKNVDKLVEPQGKPFYKKLWFCLVLVGVVLICSGADVYFLFF